MAETRSNRSVWKQRGSMTKGDGLTVACSAELDPGTMFSPRCVLVMGICGAFTMRVSWGWLAPGLAGKNGSNLA